jgi:guanylate kinase
VIKKIVSFTSRPRRDGEVDGKDYHFLTNEQIENSEAFQSIEFAGNKYGSLLNEYTTAHRFITLVHTPHTVHETISKLKETFPDINVLIIYFDISEKRLKENMKNRGDTDEMIDARLKKDDLDKQFAKQGITADFTVTDETLNTWLGSEVLRWLKTIQ